MYIYTPGQVKRYDYNSNAWDSYTSMVSIEDSVGSKVDYSKLPGTIGINRQKIKDYIALLEYTYFLVDTIRLKNAKDLNSL